MAITQKETQQRIKLYKQWMPSCTIADYREQYYDEPYYFALLAVEPYHDPMA